MANYYLSGTREGANRATMSLGSAAGANVKLMKPSNYYSDTGVFNSTPHDGDDAQKSILGYEFGKDTNTLLAMRSSATIGIKRPFRNASIYPDYVKSINYIESSSSVLTASAIRAGKFNSYTGEFNAGYPVTQTDSFGDDSAARSSRSVPGSITFLSTGNDPTSQNYPSK